eukprot:7388082-Prymnesium_polylepis.2
MPDCSVSHVEATTAVPTVSVSRPSQSHANGAAIAVPPSGAAMSHGRCENAAQPIGPNAAMISTDRADANTVERWTALSDSAAHMRCQ